MGDSNVYDGLDSTSTTDSLSANQGRVLYEMINKSCDKHEQNKQKRL